MNILGLRGDDVISEENPEMQEVLRRIPKEELYRRQYRLKVAFQKSLMHEILPKDQWTTPENVFLLFIIFFFICNSKQKKNYSFFFFLKFFLKNF